MSLDITVIVLILIVVAVLLGGKKFTDTVGGANKAETENTAKPNTSENNKAKTVKEVAKTPAKKSKKTAPAKKAPAKKAAKSTPAKKAPVKKTAKTKKTSK